MRTLQRAEPHRRRPLPPRTLRRAPRALRAGRRAGSPRALRVPRQAPRVARSARRAGSPPPPRAWAAPAAALSRESLPRHASRQRASCHPSSRGRGRLRRKMAWQSLVRASTTATATTTSRSLARRVARSVPSREILAIRSPSRRGGATRQLLSATAWKSLPSSLRRASRHTTNIPRKRSENVQKHAPLVLPLRRSTSSRSTSSLSNSRWATESASDSASWRSPRRCRTRSCYMKWALSPR